MLAPSMRMERKAYRTLSTRGSIPIPWVSARTEMRRPTPITATSRSSHSHSLGLAYRVSGKMNMTLTS